MFIASTFQLGGFNQKLGNGSKLQLKRRYFIFSTIKQTDN